MIFIELLGQSESFDDTMIQWSGIIGYEAVTSSENVRAVATLNDEKVCWKTAGSGTDTESPKSISALIDLRDWGTSDGGRPHDTGGVRGSDTLERLLLDCNPHMGKPRPRSRYTQICNHYRAQPGSNTIHVTHPTPIS